MLLMIDIGNTSTTVGVYKEKELLSHWRMETKKKATADQLAIMLREFFDMVGYKFEDIKGVAIANVVPSLQHAILSMSKRYFGSDPILVDAQNVGVEIKYPNPDEIGADRLVNAVAGFETYKSSIIIVDFGTATTFDYVDENGAYCGGAIAPGVAIANEALYHWTSKLPRVDIVKTNSVVGKSTVEAIQSGLFHGYCGLVEKIIEKMKDEVGTSPKIIATGGLASLIVGDLNIEIDRFLTLNGLRIIWERNSRSLR